jgi:tetratricopeptide (TPR) repeat protein
VNALKIIGKSYFEVGDFDNATFVLGKARNLTPEDSEVIQLLDKTNQAKRKQLESTINQYRNYLIRHPEDDNYRLKLARAYKEIGDFSKAQTEYEIYLEKNPKDKTIEQEYLSIFSNPSPKKKSMKTTHSYKSKVKCIKKPTKTKPQNKNLKLEKILDYARDLVGKEKYFEAESLYEIYLAKKPCDTIVLKEYAQTLSWNKQYDKSIIAYQKLLILNPQDKIAAFELAQVLSWAEKYNEAIVLYQTLDMTDIKILTGLAQTYYWKGDYKHARAVYRKILILDPDNSEAKKIISELPQIEIPGPEFKAIASNFWDSEEFYYKNFTAALNFHLSEKTSLEPGFSAKRFEQQNDIITGYSYSIRLAEKFSEEADGGIHYAYNYYDDVPNTHAYGLILNYVPNLLTNLTFSYDHHDIIYDVSTTRSLIQGITTDNFEVSGSHQFEKGYGLIGNYLYGLYSDDNQLQNLQARLYYQLFKILRIGYAYNLITYSEVSLWYWSPDFYQTHSIWFELANGSESPLSYYVGAEIARVTNSSKLSRSIAADISFNPSDRFSLGFQFFYSELSRTKDAPAYWQQSIAAYLRFKL